MRRAASILVLLFLLRGDARAEGLPEAWKGFFYRAPGNTASVRIASLNPTIWSWALSDWKGARVLNLYLGSAKSFKVKASLIFYPRGAKAVDGKALCKELVAKVARGAPYLMETQPVRGYRIGDLDGFTGVLAGDDEGGVRVNVIVSTYAEGKDAVATIYQASEKELTRDLAVIMKSVVDTLRLGKHVRTPLAARAPQAPLAGMFEGPGHAVLVFDARGYVSRVWPLFDLEYDLELLSQDRPDDVATYTRDGATLSWKLGGKAVSATLDGDVLTVGGATYVRVDGRGGEVKLAGRWRSEEHVVDFTSGGAATLDGAPAAWRVEGDRLIMEYPSGVTDWRPLHPHVGADGKASTDVVHIGPRTYTRVTE